MADPYAIPVQIMVRVGAGEPIALASGELEWPYSANDLADALNEVAESVRAATVVHTYGGDTYVIADSDEWRSRWRNGE